MKKYYTCVLIGLFLLACNGKPQVSNNTDVSDLKGPNDKQLNISILLDLSDRIDTTKNQSMPQHYLKDIEIVKSFADYFIADMKKKGTFNSNGKIQVIFSPAPNDPNVNLFAQKLNVDCSTMSNTQKKDVYDNLTHLFTDNVSKIYKQTLTDNKWPGCDLWRFFKNDVDMCIEDNKDYRNILVIVTDGYIYHEDTKQQENDRYSFILPELLVKYNLRNNANWEEQIKQSDFGLIAKRKDLANLEILVLEVSPTSNSYKTDEDILKVILTNWFSEMGVTRKAIFFSDLPGYTKKRISEFMTN